MSATINNMIYPRIKPRRKSEHVGKDRRRRIEDDDRVDGDKEDDDEEEIVDNV